MTMLIHLESVSYGWLGDRVFAGHLPVRTRREKPYHHLRRTFLW